MAGTAAAAATGFLVTVWPGPVSLNARAVVIFPGGWFPGRWFPGSCALPGTTRIATLAGLFSPCFGINATGMSSSVDGELFSARGGNARFSVSVDGAPMCANGANVFLIIIGADVVIGETGGIELDSVKRAGEVVCIIKGDELLNVTGEGTVLFGVDVDGAFFGADEEGDCTHGAPAMSSLSTRGKASEFLTGSSGF